MNDFEAYKLYISLKNHFNIKSYNHKKYKNNSRIKSVSFDKRNDKIFFLKLSKHKDLENFLVANFIINSKYWVKELAYSEEAENNYKEWAKRQQSLSYIFNNNLSKLDDNFDKNLIVENNQHPILLKKYLAKEICIETLCIILELTSAINYWNKNLYDPVWEETYKLVEKYIPFINYDKEKMIKICIDRYG